MSEPDEQPTILMLIPHLGRGGAESAFLRLAGYLARHTKVTIALMAPDSGIGDAEALTPLPELPIILLDGTSEPRRTLVSKAARWFRMWRRVRSLKRDCDTAISFLSGANLLNALSGPRYKTIVSERGSKRFDIGMADYPRALWTRFLDPLTYWRATKVVAASEGLSAEITLANPWTSRRVVAIEGTVESTRLLDAADLPVEADLAWLADSETIVSFGRFHVQKGYDFLIHSFSCVRATRPRARLLLVGDGPEAPRLRAMAAELGLSYGGAESKSDVVFLGMRQDPARYVRLGRVFVLPSRYEGLPNALIEALATGIPIIASDCPWGPRAILSGVSTDNQHEKIHVPVRLSYGLLMPTPDAPGALATWVEEIGKALDAPVARLGRDERLRAISRFDIERTGPVWLELIEETISSPPASRRRHCA